MRLEAALEELAGRLCETHHDLEAARAEFHARTGAFEPGEPWYEPRIRAFFDWYLCTWSVANLPSDSPIADACRSSERGLFEVLANEKRQTHVLERLGGARLRLDTDTMRLSTGDLLDGRVLVHEGRLHLAPGVLFHPPEAHAAIGSILDELSRAPSRPRREVLDGLLRMRMRLDRFTSIRAQHVYRTSALSERAIMRAEWASGKTK